MLNPAKRSRRQLLSRIRRRQQVSAAYRRRLLLEPLEDRRMLSGANPQVTLDVPAEAFIGETINFTATFDNTASPPGNVGYGPFVDLVFNRNGADGMAGTNPPLDGLTFTSATYLGTPLTTTILTFSDDGGGMGCVDHPYAVDTSGTPLEVCGTAGDQLIVLQLPFGSFTPDQPEVTIDISADMSNLADLGVPLDVQARGGFQFGCDELNNPSVDPTILTPGSTGVDSSTWVESGAVTPILITMEKAYLGPEDETATGPNFPQQYELTVNIAPGQTVTDLDIIDGFDNNIVVTGITFMPAATGVPSTPFGPSNFDFGMDELLLGTVASVMGTGAGDVTVLIDFYVTEFDADGMRVIPLDGEDETASSVTENDSRAVGDWTPNDPRDAGGVDNATAEPDPLDFDHVLDDKSIAIQKSVAVVGGGGSGPGVTLEYTLEFQVSDFYTFGDLMISDTFSDGQDFDFSFSPTLNITDQDGNVMGTFTLNTDFTHTANGDFTETVDFNVSAAMVNNGAPDGILRGGYATEPDMQDEPPNTPPLANVGATGTVVFRTTIPDFYDDPPGTRVAQGDTVTNDADISGTVRDNNAIGTTIGTEDDDTSASTEIPVGELTKSIYAVNGTFPPPGGFILSPGDELTYSLEYEMPLTSFVDFSIDDFLPLPVIRVDDPDADGVAGPAWTFNVETMAGDRANPPAAGVVELGPNDTFFDYRPFGVDPPPNTDVDDPPNFFSPPTLSTDTDANSLSFFYGDFNDPDNGTTTIHLLFTVTVNGDPMADGLFLTNISRAFESNTESNVSIGDSIVQIQLGQPVLNITKGVVATNHPQPPATFSPDPPVAAPLTITPPGTAGYRFSGTVNSDYLSGGALNSDLSDVDAGDLVTFSIIVENTGSSRTGAFDIQVSDTLPAGFVIPGGGLNLSVTDGTGAAIAFTDLGGGIFGSGLELTDPGPTPAQGDGTDGGALDQFDNTNGRNVLVITYDLLADTSVVPREEITNTAQIDAYAGIEGGTNHVSAGNEPSDDATVTILDPTVDKVIIGTNQAHTTGNNVAIGEIVTYATTITIPEGTTTDALFVDRLDNGLAFVDIVSITASPGVSTDVAGGFPGVAAGVTVNTVGSLPNGGGREFELDFGNVTNTNTDNATAETIVVTYRVVVINSTNNNRGNGRNNQADWRWETDEGTQQVRDSAPNVTIVEPTMQVVKTAMPTTGNADDTITFTLDISHTAASNADAFNVELEDIIPAGMTYVAASLMNTAGLVPDTLMEAGGTITATWASFPDGSTSQLQFDVTLDVTVVPGTVITNDADIQWTSLPGDVTTPQSAFNTISTERTGDPADPGGAANDYNATDPAEVTIESPNFAKSLTGTNQAHTAGLDVAIGEIVEYTTVVTVPEGTFPDAMIVDTPAAGLAIVDVLSITASPGLATDVAGGFPTVLANANASIPVDGSNVTFDFGTVTNSDMDDGTAETITIVYRAVVLNEIANSRGSTLDNEAVLTWSDGMLAAVGDTITIVEPTLVVDKSNGNPLVGDAGDTISFTITVQHDANSDADAFDVNLMDLINSVPNGMTYSPGSVMVMNMGGAVLAMGSPSDAGGDLDITWTDFPLGASATITFDVTLDLAVGPDQTLTNTTDVTWTSLPGDVTTPQSSNPVSTERTGDPGDPGGAANSYSTSDDGVVLTPTITAAKLVLDTSEPITGTGQHDGAITDLTIGETVTFAIAIQFIDGTTNNVVITDNLPVPAVLFDPGVLEFVNATLEFVGADLTDGAMMPITLPVPMLTDTNGDGVDDQVVLDFGTIVNAIGGSDADNEMVIGIEARLIDEYPSPPAPANTPANVNGQLLTNTLTGTADNVPFPIMDTAEVEAVEPDLVITKAAAPLVVAGGDTVTFTITVDHTMASTADAFDVAITDMIPAGLTYAGNVTAITGPAPMVSLALPTATFSWTDIPLGAGPYVFSFDVTVDSSIMPGDTFVNTADLEWTSLPGVDPEERTYTDTDDAPTITSGVTAMNQAKSQVATSEPSTAGSNVAVGEIVRYRLQADFTGGTFPNLEFRDTLPAGLSLIDVDEVRVSFSTNTTWTVDADLLGAVNNHVPPTFVLPMARVINPAGPTITFDLGDVTNETATGGTITLEYNVLVENTMDTNDGDVLSNGFDLFVDAAQIGMTESTDVTVVEPSIVDVDKQLISDIPFGAGETVTYQVTFSNTGNATAFEVQFLDNLDPTLFTNVVLDSVVLGGGATGVTDNSAGNTIDITIEEIPVGGTVTIEYSADMADGVESRDIINNTADVVYTGLPGTGTAEGPDNPTGSTTPGGSGDANGERDGSGGVNDYTDTDPESFEVLCHPFTLVLDDPSTPGLDIIIVDNAPIGTRTALGVSNAADFYDSIEGLIFYLGPVGNISSVAVSSTSTRTTPGADPEIIVSGQILSAGAGKIDIITTDTCFEVDTGGAFDLTTPIGGVTDGTVMFQEIVDVGNNAFADGTGPQQSTNDLGTLGPDDFSGTESTSFATDANDPFSLTKRGNVCHEGSDTRITTLSAAATVHLVSAITHNVQQPTDVDGNGVTLPVDALILVNALNTFGPARVIDYLSGAAGNGVAANRAYYDVNADGLVTPIDVILVINELNRMATSAVQGEGERTEPVETTGHLWHDELLVVDYGSDDAGAPAASVQRGFAGVEKTSGDSQQLVHQRNVAWDHCPERFGRDEGPILRGDCSLRVASPGERTPQRQSGSPLHAMRPRLPREAVFAEWERLTEIDDELSAESEIVVSELAEALASFDKMMGAN